MTDLRQLAEAAERMPWDTSPSDVPLDARLALQKACTAERILALLDAVDKAKAHADKIERLFDGCSPPGFSGWQNGHGKEVGREIDKAATALRASLARVDAGGAAT